MVVGDRQTVVREFGQSAALTWRDELAVITSPSRHMTFQFHKGSRKQAQDCRAFE
jgi:hypothetical protein